MRARRAQRRARARHRLRAGDRGLGVGGRAGRRRDQRARGRRRAGHDRRGRRAARPACPRRRSRSTRPTTSRVLRVEGLDLPALRARDRPRLGRRAGRSSATPRTAPSTCSPGASGARRRVLTQNAYGQGPVSRLLTPLRGLVRPGNSGGPLVDADGRVLDDRVREHRRAARRRAATGSRTRPSPSREARASRQDAGAHRAVRVRGEHGASARRA